MTVYSPLLGMVPAAMTTDAMVGPMLAAFDSFWVIVAIAIGSAIYNWLQKRSQTGADAEPQPPPESPQPRQAPTRSQQQPAPRQTKAVSWEEELRRLLEGDAPEAPLPPPPPPLVVVEKKPPAPPPLPVRARPDVKPPSPAAGRPLATLTEAASAAQRVEELNKKVEAHLGHVASMASATAAFQKASGLDVAVAERMSKVTGHLVAPAAVVKHKTDSPEVAQVVSLFRNPRTARQAIIASFIIGPPKAMED